MKTTFCLGLAVFSLSIVSAENSDHSCPPHIPYQPPSWKNKMRVNALKKIDRFLAWSTSQRLKTFVLVNPPEQKTYDVAIPEINEFDERYGYFSLERPIVGKVTTNPLDLKLVCCLLRTLYDKAPGLKYLELATAEILAKALAYRDLKKGQKIQIPMVAEGSAHLETYTVAQIFNLWHGMPAFGLVPEQPRSSPLLLFRGTDLSMDSERGWASLMSDLDMAGPGLSAFQHAQKKIHAWLTSLPDPKAKVIGFSLGGALAAYTFIYENAWIAPHGSIAFCPPGVSEKVIEDWQLLPEKNKPGFTIYVNEGDIISKIGKLFGTVFELSAKKPLRPLSAHEALMSTRAFFGQSLVDVTKENLAR